MAHPADVPPPEAKRHADACVKAYDLAEYERAIKECKAAYEIYPAALLLFSLGQTYRKLGENEKALEFYRKYLAKAPNGSQRKAAEEQVVQLAALIESTQRTRKAPPDSVMPSDLAPDKSPSRGQTSPMLTTQPDKSVQSANTSVSPPPTVPRTKTDRWQARPTAIGSYVAFGVGVVAAAVAAGLMARAENLDSDARVASTLSEQLRFTADGSTYRTTGYAMLGVAGGAFVVGSVLVGVASVRRSNAVAINSFSATQPLW